jgi:hypothetical protein
VTVTVVAPADTDLDKVLHWPSGIHSQFSTPMYVTSGDSGAVCTSARASGIRPSAVVASCSGVGGPGSWPGAVQMIWTLQVDALPPDLQLVHCHSDPSAWPCHAGVPGGASYGAA